MPAGRPTVINNEVIAKLESAFSKGHTVLEACLIADISKDAYYNYCKDNPELKERVELLREQPAMHARRNLADSIESGDLGNSRWYLERKNKAEFSTSADINLGGQNGDNPIDMNLKLEFIAGKND